MLEMIEGLAERLGLLFEFGVLGKLLLAVAFLFVDLGEAAFDGFEGLLGGGVVGALAKGFFGEFHGHAEEAQFFVDARDAVLEI